MNILKSALEIIKYIISPAACRYCKRILTVYKIFCHSCSDKIKPIISTNLKINKNLSIPIYAISDYANPIKKLILNKAFSDHSASIAIAQLIYDYNIIAHLNFDFIVPIPLHWSRYASRGYNQSEIIAQELSKFTNKPVLNCLKRTKRTLFQSSLSGKERKDNLKNAFDINIDPSLIMHKKLLLVDDLMTTGSTFVSAAKVLSKYNIEKIYCVVACRVHAE